MQSISRVRIPRSIALYLPPKDHLAQVLQDGLKSQFEEVTVEWVDCPDLTQEPFNLAASGLCGSEGLLDITDAVNVLPMSQTQNLGHILKQIGRTNGRTFVIGTGAYPQIPYGNLGELIMNACFTVTDGNLVTLSRSQIATVNERTRNCRLELLRDPNIECNSKGSFFVSDGNPGSVLKVQVKKRKGFNGFVQTMQESLLNAYCQGDWLAPVGLGGTFVMNNAKALLSIMPNSWPYPLTEVASVNHWLRYYKTNAPVVAVGTLTNKDCYYFWKTFLSNTMIDIMRSSNFHAFSHEGIGGNFYSDVMLYSNTVEYLGYFCPAKTLFTCNPTPFV